MRINLPNGDMVGHTGDIEATVVACKAADEAVKVRTNKKLCFMLSLKVEMCIYLKLHMLAQFQ